VTTASSKAPRICAKRLPVSMPGWTSSVAGLRLGEDPHRPQRAVQALLGHAQEGVGEGDGHEHARVEHCAV
jgi:hypothetical protein